MSLRQAAKRLVERGLRLLPLSFERLHGRALILAYHNVVPDDLGGGGDGSLHLTTSAFKHHLDVLEASCEVRPLGDVLAGARSETGPVVAVTFDDAYRGAVSLALPEMACRGLSCTLFVAPGLLGRHALWWDQLAITHGGLAPWRRRRALETYEGRHELIQAAMIPDALAIQLPPCYGCATDAEVRLAGRLAGVTLAAHSWSHPNLNRIDQHSLSGELAKPLEWLNSVSSATLNILAYPYGLGGSAVATAARSAGYSAGLLVSGGWITSLEDPWRVPRFNVPAGLSLDGFVLRLAGILRLPADRQLS